MIRSFEIRVTVRYWSFDMDLHRRVGGKNIYANAKRGQFYFCIIRRLQRSDFNSHYVQVEDA